MKKITSLWGLSILLFLSACSSHQSLKQVSYQEEAKEDHRYNHRPSIRMEEESEEYYEQHKKQK